MSKILITGGMGFIGSELVKSLFFEHEIFIFDNPRLEIINYFLDLPVTIFNRNNDVDKILDIDPDIIVHLGAKSNTDLKDPYLAYENNTFFTNKLINYALNKKIKLIYASSAATYGGGEHGFIDYDDFYELRKFKPKNLYGWSKHNSDLYFAHKMLNTKSLSNIVGLKFFNVYGHNEAHKGHMASVISQMIPKIKANKRIKLFRYLDADKKYKEASRDFIYSGDVIKIIKYLINIDFKATIMNIGTGQAISFSEFIKKGFANTIYNPRINFQSLPKIYEGKYQIFTKASIKKLNAVIPDLAFTSIPNSINKML